MPVYQYAYKDASGKTKKAKMEAANEAAVMTKLREMRIKPTSVKKSGTLDMEINIPFLNRVTEKELVVFTRQFATMIDSGLPLVQCLEIQASQAENPEFRKQLRTIKETVEGGATFADALRKFPDTFDELFVNLVAAGEVGGILDTILNRLAAYIEKNSKLKKQVKSAMTYPIGVLVISAVVVAILLIKVVPQFEKMFSEFGRELPLPTQVVIAISDAAVTWWWVVPVGGAGIYMAYNAAMKSKKVHYFRDSLLLKSPVFGDVIRKVAVARLCRTLSTMISSGVPILDALDICSKTAGNKVVERAIMQTRESISEGRTIAEPLAESGVFPGMVTQMIAVGEATGALDTMLSKIADFYEDEVEAAVGALTSLMEPALMAFLGVVVGGLAIAMYMPIFEMASAISE